MAEDPSHGYEAAAEAFMAARSDTGSEVVRAWAASLPEGASVLDLGAGHGEPLTKILLERGLSVAAVDASQAMVAAFRRRFPDVEVACEPAERSAFFGRRFGAVLAVGLVFLLFEENQKELFRRIGRGLEPGGRLLFSAPQEICTWKDVLTGRVSRSLGAEAYGRILSRSGLHLLGGHTDGGGNHYYEAERTGP